MKVDDTDENVVKNSEEFKILRKVVLLPLLPHDEIEKGLDFILKTLPENCKNNQQLQEFFQ